MSARFPMPAGVVGKILRAAADPDVTVSDLARLLETDAVLSAQLLKTVNSASFGLRNKVAAVDRAVALMGIRAVRNLVMSLCVRDLVPVKDVSGFPIELFWEASLRRGASAKCVAERLELPNTEEYFTMGLCQDIGILVHLEESPGLADDLERNIREAGDLRLGIEREAGASHAEIGFEMFSEWSFPEELTLPVRYHHEPWKTPEAHRQTAMVAHAAEALADLCGIDDKKSAIDTASERLAGLGLDPEDVGAIVSSVNTMVAEFAELLGLDVAEQPSYDEIVAIASAGLAVLNTDYEESNRKLQEALAEQQRMAAEMEHLNKELDRQARTDSLTGLPNRRAFDEAMQRELFVAQRQESVLSVVIMDIDHFKQFNDSHGHAAGDRVLAAVGETLRKLVRLSDGVARLGGEEFALIFPFTNEDGAKIAAERFRAAVESTKVEWEGQTLNITASLGGISVERIPTVDEELAVRILKQADDALYRAKTEGRNRVCWNVSVLEVV